MAVPVVSDDVMAQLWLENSMDARRSDQLFVEQIVHQTAAGDPRYMGGLSVIVKLITGNGQHVGTVHEIRQPDGTLQHSHPKDYTLRDCSRVRVR